MAAPGVAAGTWDAATVEARLQSWRQGRGQPSEVETMSAEELAAEKAELKRILAEAERYASVPGETRCAGAHGSHGTPRRDFAQRNGRAPGKEDKQPLRPYYRRYKLLRSSVTARRDDAKADAAAAGALRIRGSSTAGTQEAEPPRGKASEPVGSTLAAATTPDSLVVIHEQPAGEPLPAPGNRTAAEADPPGGARSAGAASVATLKAEKRTLQRLL